MVYIKMISNFSFVWSFLSSSHKKDLNTFVEQIGSKVNFKNKNELKKKSLTKMKPFNLSKCISKPVYFVCKDPEVKKPKRYSLSFLKRLVTFLFTYIQCNINFYNLLVSPKNLNFFERPKKKIVKKLTCHICKPLKISLIVQKLKHRPKQRCFI